MCLLLVIIGRPGCSVPQYAGGVDTTCSIGEAGHPTVTTSTLVLSAYQAFFLEYQVI